MSETMECSDTVKLLGECNSGTKMAVSSIDEVMTKVECSDLKQLLQESRLHHEKIGNEIHSRLLEQGADDKEPGAMAKSMSWMKTNMKLAAHESDETIADLMTDGCNMGIKSLYRYMNEYQNADIPSKEICGRLIAIEETLQKELQQYL